MWISRISAYLQCIHYGVIKWKHFPRYWPFVRGIQWSPVNFPHKGQWCGPLMFSFIYSWINRRVNNREAGDLRRHRAHYDVIVMFQTIHHVSIHIDRMTFSCMESREEAIEVSHRSLVTHGNHYIDHWLNLNVDRQRNACINNMYW